MAYAVDFVLADDAAEQVRRLRAGLATVGVTVPETEPSVRFALANAIPMPALARLTEDLRLLVLPELWLATLGSALTSEPALLLVAIPDAELLAAHTTVHDALAGRARAPVARYLPGQWVPHCPLSRELTPGQLGRAIAGMGAPEPIRAKVSSVCVTDTRTGGCVPLRGQ